MRVRVSVAGLLALLGSFLLLGCGDDRQVVHTQPQVQSTPPPPSVQGGANSDVAFGDVGTNSSVSAVEENGPSENVGQLPRPVDVSQWSSRDIIE